MRCGLLGRTLSHSHSPLLHSLLGRYDYALFEIPPEQVEDFLRNEVQPVLERYPQALEGRESELKV